MLYNCQYTATHQRKISFLKRFIIFCQRVKFIYFCFGFHTVFLYFSHLCRLFYIVCIDVFFFLLLIFTNIKTDSSEFMKTYQELPEVYQDILTYAMKRLSEVSPTDVAMQIKQRHVERLGDIEDKLEQERQTKEKDETSCA